MAFQCTQILTMICPCQSSPSDKLSLHEAPPSILSLKHATPFPIYTPLLAHWELPWPDRIWCCCHDLRFFGDTFPDPTGQGCSSLFPTGIPHPTARCISFKDFFCIIIWSLIVFHWSMNSRRVGTFFLLFTSVCPVPAHNMQWMKIT